MGRQPPARDAEEPGDSIVVIVSEDDDGERLDRVLAEHTDATRSQLKKRIDDGHCRVNRERVTRPAHTLSTGDRVQIRMPDVRRPLLEPEPIPLVAVHEDADIAVLDKPAGMVVHPSRGHDRGTLVHALLARYGDLPACEDPRRPGIVHRIDRETSGLIVVARSTSALAKLQQAFSRHAIERAYVALCAKVTGTGFERDTGTFRTRHGRHPGNRLKFTGSCGSREAITHYRVLERFEHGVALVRCELETGRTHQIRMHLSEHGTPLLGDALYGGAALARTPRISRVALHAALLGFEHPATGAPLRFEAPLPDDMADAVAALRTGQSWH